MINPIPIYILMALVALGAIVYFTIDNSLEEKRIEIPQYNCYILELELLEDDNYLVFQDLFKQWIKNKCYSDEWKR